MSVARLPFIDTMKAAGMFLIVAGHVVGGPVNFISPPIYPKQMGVAFFMFVTAYTLARETRPRAQVVVGRLFELVVVCAIAAIVLTALSFATGGGGQLSNFKPLLLGVNVLDNHFPANPTTWYVGTYIHVILLWAAFRRALRPTPTLILVSAVVEVAVRLLVWQAVGAFVAYMLVPNWMTVWLLGAWCGQRGQQGGLQGRSDAVPTMLAVIAVAVPLGCGVAWSFDDSFPFRVAPGLGASGQLVTSAGVTLLYVGGTWLAFLVAQRLPAGRWVEFAAAQTVIIFVVHMPLYYLLLPLMADWSRPARGVLLVLICYVGLGAASGFVRHWTRLPMLKQRFAGMVAQRQGSRG